MPGHFAGNQPGVFIFAASVSILPRSKKKAQGNMVFVVSPRHSITPSSSWGLVTSVVAGNVPGAPTGLAPLAWLGMSILLRTLGQRALGDLC